MVRRCSLCGEGHGPDVAFCPNDGAALQDEGGDLRPGDVLGAYRLTRLLGEGGMGQVYQAEHRRIGRKVAIKVLWPTLAENQTIVKRFCAEAEAVNRFQHPHIVEIVDFVDKPIPFCVMELLDGQDLESLLEERILGVSRILRISNQMVDALHAAHQAGIVHRDLKPSNVFLVQRNDVRDFVKILDFGIAKSTQASPASKRVQTTAGMVLGTPEYMSPEQASGRPVDHRTDIYSFGVMLYEMACGKPPFSGDSVGELLVKHITQQPPPPSSLKEMKGRVPAALERLILACLTKEPDERPSDMGVVMKILKKVPACKDEDLLRAGSATSGVEVAETAALPAGASAPQSIRRPSREVAFTETARSSGAQEAAKRARRVSGEVAARSSGAQEVAKRARRVSGEVAARPSGAQEAAKRARRGSGGADFSTAPLPPVAADRKKKGRAPGKGGAEAKSEWDEDVTTVLDEEVLSTPEELEDSEPTLQEKISTILPPGEDEKKTSWSRGRVAALAALVLGASAVLLVLILRPGDDAVEVGLPDDAVELVGDPGQEGPAEEPEVQGDAGVDAEGAGSEQLAEEETVTLELSSVPAGARVFRGEGEEDLGETPVTLTLSKGSEVEEFVFRLRGHEDFVEEVPLDTSARIRVALRPISSTREPRRAVSTKHQPRPSQPAPQKTVGSDTTRPTERAARPTPRPSEGETKQPARGTSDDVHDPFPARGSPTRTKSPATSPAKQDRDEVFDPFSD